MKSIITIFDGEHEIVLSREEIAELGPRDLVDRFQSTAVYRDLINDSVELDSVVAVNGQRPTGAMLLRLERGFVALFERMEEVFGPDSAAEIWSKVSNTIQLEKCTQ
jgi:hypothetical protein